MSHRTCSKCGQAMHGPLFSESSNLLHWRCSCGFRDTTRPRDAEAASMRAKLAELGLVDFQKPQG